MFPVHDSTIQRTPHPDAGFSHHMRVYLRRAHILVAEQVLDSSDVITILQKMRRPRKSLRSTRPATWTESLYVASRKGFFIR
jgi:hypothetical protein